MGGMLWWCWWFFDDDDCGGGSFEDCLVEVVSDEPVSIWTTCLKFDVSACTKVVG